MIFHFYADGEVKINGGVPQEGFYSKHLEKFEHDVNTTTIESFEGIAVINFGGWRPIYRQNWGSLIPIKTLSEKIVKEKHNLEGNSIVEEATRNFEIRAKLFMEGTLKLAKKLRPNAKWGYYGYPHCYNFGSNETNCIAGVQEENDRY